MGIATNLINFLLLLVSAFTLCLGSTPTPKVNVTVTSTLPYGPSPPLPSSRSTLFLSRPSNGQHDRRCHYLHHRHHHCSIAQRTAR
ncbi:hypothetical protein BDV97DRAFT_354587 [Delphinella strobiligena]|nr:hypothetical protein BDV97DRAFT_354587 [Delphinella strobiligena]